MKWLIEEETGENLGLAVLGGTYLGYFSCLIL